MRQKSGFLSCVTTKQAACHTTSAVSARASLSPSKKARSCRSYDRGSCKHGGKRRQFSMFVCSVVLNTRDYCSHLVGELRQSSPRRQHILVAVIKAAAVRIAWHHFKRIWNNVPIQQFQKTRGERERKRRRERELNVWRLFEKLVTLLPSVSLDMKVLPVLWRSKLFPSGWNAIVCQTKDMVS